MDKNPFTLGTACVPLDGDVVLPFATLDATSPLICTVSARTRIFVTVINYECSVSEGNGQTPAELRACAINDVKGYTTHRATLDGQPLRQELVATRPFSVVFPPDNILGTSDPGTMSVGNRVPPVDSVTTIIVRPCR